MALAGSLISLGTFVIIYGLLALGLNLKFGFNGLLDIGHVAFYLIGAYTAALLVLPPPTAETQQYATYILGLEWTWPAAIVVATIVAGVAGMLVALPAIRLREDYLAITVLGISVIAKRVIQTETWLANGPSSLKGWAKPLAGMFPLPGGDQSFELILFGAGLLDVTLFQVPAPVLLGAIVLGVWAILVYGVASYLPRRETDGSGGSLFHGLVAVLTLGVGYLFARLARREEQSPAGRYALAGGLVAGLVATGMAFLGSSVRVGLPLLGSVAMNRLAVVAFMGLASVLTWVLAGAVLVDHYGDLPRRDAILGVALGLVFVVVFAPVAIFGGGSDQVMAGVGLLLTAVFAAAYVAVLYYLGNNWEAYGSGGAFLSVLGVSAASLFLLRYFVLSLIVPLKAGDVAGAATTTVVNIVWLLQIGENVALNYARFRFLSFVILLAGAYYVLRQTVRSPFGRALKAVRDDEEVADALGKNVFRFKVQSMIVGSALAGLAGALFALWFGALTHTSFRPRITFVALLIVIIGGTANNRGVILGAAIYWAFQKGTATLASNFFPAAVASKISAVRLALIGALFIAIIYYRPEGIWGEQPVSMEEVE